MLQKLDVEGPAGIELNGGRTTITRWPAAGWQAASRAESSPVSCAGHLAGLGDRAAAPTRFGGRSQRSVAVRGPYIAALFPWPHDPRTCGPASGMPRAVRRLASAMVMPRRKLRSVPVMVKF